MGRVVYEVPLVKQAANPICWVASMAMVASERRGCSIGVGEFASGFDPSNSSIPNPAVSLDDFYRRLERCGFGSVAVNPNTAELESALQNMGPLILTHYCSGFPYGAGWAPIADANATHAIVITGIDSTIHGGTCWMNNPWGNKGRPILTSAVIAAIIRWQASNFMPIAYYVQ